MKTKFIRNTKIENNYMEMHKISPQVSYLRETGNCYHVKLSYKNKDYIITEYMKHGLTDRVILEHDGITEEFKRVYDAEVRANNLMRGKEWLPLEGDTLSELPKK